jgi:hypothetical protein
MWKKYCIAGQVTDDNIIRRMVFACWITKAAGTHSEYLILIPFPGQQWFTKACLCYVIVHCLVCNETLLSLWDNIHTQIRATHKRYMATDVYTPVMYLRVVTDSTAISFNTERLYAVAFWGLCHAMCSASWEEDTRQWQGLSIARDWSFRTSKLWIDPKIYLKINKPRHRKHTAPT